MCVDERWLSSSLIKKFGGLVNSEEGATTSDYLEKIFQIPYWTRPMNAKARSKFAKYLADSVEAREVEPEEPEESEESEEPEERNYRELIL